MVKTSNYTLNRAVVCQEAINEWNKVKKKSVDDIDSVIQDYMATPLNLYDIQSMRYKRFTPLEKLNPPSPSPSNIYSVPEIPANTSAQRRVADAIKVAEKIIYESEQIYNITSDAQIRDQMCQKIGSLRNEVKSNKDRIDKLKKMLNMPKIVKKKN
jgi:predicted DNA-binding protein YlxM (UPF0122 family)